MYENTLYTYVDTRLGQIYRTFASKVNVVFDYKRPWYYFVPVLNWIVPLIYHDSGTKKYDIGSYTFKALPKASAPISLVNDRSDFGYIIVGLTQS